MDTSNTGENRKPGTFVQGDPRINRKGRPRTFDKLRKLAVQIAGEPHPSDEKITRIIKMLRDMAESKNPTDRALFLAYAYGKPKEEIEHSGELHVNTMTPEQIATRVSQLMALAQERKEKAKNGNG